MSFQHKNQPFFPQVPYLQEVPYPERVDELRKSMKKTKARANQITILGTKISKVLQGWGREAFVLLASHHPLIPNLHLKPSIIQR